MCLQPKAIYVHPVQIVQFYFQRTFVLKLKRDGSRDSEALHVTVILRTHSRKFPFPFFFLICYMALKEFNFGADSKILLYFNFFFCFPLNLILFIRSLYSVLTCTKFATKGKPFRLIIVVKITGLL